MRISTNSTPKSIHAGNHFTKIARNSSLYLVSSLVTKFSTLLLLPLMTRLLSPSDYGLIANLQAIIQFSTVFMSLYIDSAYDRFYFEYNDCREKLARYTSTFFMFVLLWGLLPTGALGIVGYRYIAGAYSVTFFPLIFLTTISPLLIQLSVFGHSFLRNNLKTTVIVMRDLAIFLLSTGISLVLMLGFDLSVTGRFWGIFAGIVITCCFYTWVLAHEGLLSWHIDKQILRESLKFSIPLVPLAMSSWITTLSDRIILTYYTDISEAGLYDVAYRISQGIRVITESVFQVYAPMMVSMYTHDRSQFNKKVGQFATYFVWIMFFAAFYISIFSKEILVLLTAPEYHSSYKLVPVIVFAYFISAQTKYLSSVFSLRKITYLSTIGYILQAIINLALNILLIPHLGKAAAAWSTFASLLFLTCWCGYWFLRLEDVAFEWCKIFKIFVIGAFAFAVYFTATHVFTLSLLPMLFLKLAVTAPPILALTLVTGVINFRDLKGLFYRNSSRSFRNA